MDINEFEGLFKPVKRSVNLIIIAINVVMFIVTAFFSIRAGGNLDFTAAFLLDFGALYKPLIGKGETWRLFTYMFLHGGISHIANNMLILYFMGNYLERSIGHVRYFAVYILSGLLAGLGSIMYNVDISVGVGASGAIFGVFGAVFSLVLTRRGREAISLRQMMIFIGLSVYSGFTSTGVDNMAHVSGLIAGAVIGFFLTFFEGRGEGRESR